MLYIAFLLLARNKEKYLGIILGLTFTSFIMTQPLGIFLGNLELTYGLINDISLPDIWVMHPKLQSIDDIKHIPKTALYRVASIKGVKWAQPLFKGLVQARINRGSFQTCRIIGLDEATLIGAPGEMVAGSIENLRYGDNVIIDEENSNNKLAYYNKKLKHKAPLLLGDTLEINNYRAVVGGLAKLTRTIQSYPTIYTGYANALKYTSSPSNLASFVLVKANEGEDLTILCENIAKLTGLQAYTKEDFKKLTAWYFIKNTGALFSLAASILIAFLVGGLITGQIFYNFTRENFRYFGLLKAMGSSQETLSYMILFQALITSLIGYAMGIGATALTVLLTHRTMITFSFPIHIFLVSFFSIISVSFYSAFLIIKKTSKIDPEIIFRG